MSSPEGLPSLSDGSTFDSSPLSSSSPAALSPLPVFSSPSAMSSLAPPCSAASSFSCSAASSFSYSAASSFSCSAASSFSASSFSCSSASPFSCSGASSSFSSAAACSSGALPSSPSSPSSFLASSRHAPSALSSATSAARGEGQQALWPAEGDVVDEGENDVHGGEGEQGADHIAPTEVSTGVVLFVCVSLLNHS